MPRRGQNQTPEPPILMDASFHFIIGEKLGETNSLLQALRLELRALPYQMAQHMALYLAHSHPHPKSGDSLTYMTRLTRLLESGRSYLVLIWRISLLTGLITLMAKGTFSAKDVADYLIASIKGAP